MPAVYGASKLHHAQMWIDLAKRNRDITWRAKWPTLIGKVDDSPENARVFWELDIANVHKSLFVLVYALPGEHLRGALVEVGVALGANRYVVTVGSHEDFGTWQYHKNVLRAASMENALWMIRTMSPLIGRVW